MARRNVVLTRPDVDSGTPLHGMRARMTVDDTMLIVAFEALTEHGPYAICPAAALNFGRLAGLRIGPGFLRAAAERVGGTQGCTHLRELLQPMATVAFQTLAAVRRPRKAEQEAQAAKPALLNTCLAYASDGAVVQRAWPHLYTGRDDAPG